MNVTKMTFLSKLFDRKFYGLKLWLTPKKLVVGKSFKSKIKLVQTFLSISWLPVALSSV